MGNNVIILGAGFSYDAGIPLMSGFVETMWELAIRKSYKGRKLDTSDIKIFEEAAQVRTDLDSYHGRANFDDRNIEDILSILSFNVISGSPKAKNQLEAMNRAISRTIEITCTVKHPGIPEDGKPWNIIQEGNSQYRDLWVSLFDWESKGNELPTFITFNYDLVLERALLQVLINKTYGAHQLPFSRFRINYHFPQIENEIWSLDRCQYNRGGTDYGRTDAGTVLKRTGAKGADTLTEIDILKLHGSVNFPSKTKNGLHNIAESIEDPYILPPIFNKMSSSNPSDMWKTALEKISTAHNITIVGYSLPRTDIYMQYFLKAALGPNVDINKIFVFDPILYENNDREREMKLRYEGCFSQQLRNRIIFRPEPYDVIGNQTAYGSASHFVNILNRNPETLLF